MGLGNVLGSALSGLRTTQAGLDVVSRNVANSDSVGYVRRTVHSVEEEAGGLVTGARNGSVQRMLDKIVQRQLWQESSGAAYTSTRADTLSAVDRMFGAPGSASALDATFSRFINSIQSLKSDPSSYATRSAVLDTAGQLASRLNDMSAGIQDLRSQAEGAIDQAIDEVNSLLTSLKQVNARVINAPADQTTASLKDERDRILGDLSRFIDIRSTEDANGSVSVVTTSGMQLFDGQQATKFSFDARPALGPEATWNASATLRSVGTISALDGNGGSVDVIAGRLFRSGEIAAWVELRDTTLVQAQSQLDELAAQMASALSDQEVAGTAATVGAATGFDVDTAALQSGNRLTLDYTITPAGTQRKFTFVRVDSATALPLPPSAAGDVNNPVIGINFALGMASVVTQIQTAVGAGFTVSNTGSVLRIVDDGAGATRDVRGLTARPSNTTLTNGGATPPVELPFFVDGGRNNAVYTGSFEGSSQRVGFAGRIVVNPGLTANRASLVVFGTAPATAQGDATRPQLIFDRLTKSVRDFSPSTGIGGRDAAYSASVANFAQRIVQTQGQNVEAANRLDEGQQVALSSIESRFAAKSGVNVDQEMSSLVELQTAYAANARVISAVKEMMDLLLRV